MYGNIKTLALLFFLTLASGSPGYCQESETCDRLYLPLASFDDRSRCGDLSKRSLDGFGAYRKAGHKHAGLDIEAEYGERVFSVGQGKACAIYGRFPYLTVIIEHSTPAGRVFYSSYTHIEDICVTEGDIVNENTPICRAFSMEEFERSGYDKNHIHLEIRKTIDDIDVEKRVATNCHSIHCYTEGDLNRYFYDPMLFFSNYPSK